MLYILYAAVARSRVEILSNVLVGMVVFGILLVPYTKGILGGGDIKLVAVAALWVGMHCAELFALLLLVLVSLHVTAFKLGWTPASPKANGEAIPYAPAVAGALIGTILFGCA